MYLFIYTHIFKFCIERERELEINVSNLQALDHCTARYNSWKRQRTCCEDSTVPTFWNCRNCSIIPPCHGGKDLKSSTATSKITRQWLGCEFQGGDWGLSHVALEDVVCHLMRPSLFFGGHDMFFFIQQDGWHLDHWNEYIYIYYISKMGWFADWSDWCPVLRVSQFIFVQDWWVDRYRKIQKTIGWCKFVPCGIYEEYVTSWNKVVWKVKVHKDR